MKRFVLALAAGVLLAFPLAAQTQQVTKVGICNFTSVLNSVYKDTKTVRDYNQAVNDYNKEVTARRSEITDLQNQKLDADKANNKTLSDKLAASIADKQLYLDTLQRTRGVALQQQGAALLTQPIVQEIYNVIQYIAETGGYSLILRTDGAYGSAIIYNIKEIDITDDVIKELLSRQVKPTGGQ